MIVIASLFILIVITVILLEIEHSIEMKKLLKEYERITEEKIELTDQEKFRVLLKLTEKIDFKE